MAASDGILIGIDAGTSVIKSVAFDLSGRQIAVAATPNLYTTRPDGAAFQPLRRTWEDCAATLRALADRVPDLARRAVALAVTAQGDGTWLVGRDNMPVGDGWLWLDSRSAGTADRIRAGAGDAARFAATGAGIAACQMGPQLAHMLATDPDTLARAEVALHPKDWLYLNLTGVRATDPSEANFTFGDFRTRRYSDDVVEILGLGSQRHLLPEIVDGTTLTHPLTPEAATATGLPAGLPVSLGFVDVVCTALGAGIHTGGAPAGCTIVGSTGMHMRATRPEDVVLNAGRTGYVMVLPVPGMVAQMQSNMAATLNIDWALALAGDLLADMGHSVSREALIGRIEGWVAEALPGALLYHPYISDAGERGPFVNVAARAGFVGLRIGHRFPDLMRAVIEGLTLAARDCYAEMGPIPAEIRLSGGAARSRGLRRILGACLDRPVRVSARDEAGAAGAAMMAAVANGIYPDMNACIGEWVTPLLGATEAPDRDLVAVYDRIFPAYVSARQSLLPVWAALSDRQENPA